MPSSPAVDDDACRSAAGPMALDPRQVPLPGPAAIPSMIIATCRGREALASALSWTVCALIKPQWSARAPDRRHNGQLGAAQPRRAL